MKISASVVTYNRLEFLQDLVEALRNQTRKPDYIIVVDNSSTDGTKEWLAEQEDLIVVFQDNVGSTGGQFRAIHTALNTDADYFWVMDDDVLPDENCIKNLIPELNENRVIAPLRWNKEGTIFFNEPISFNLTNPFSSIRNSLISQEYLDKFDNFIPVDGITFEGPIFHRNLIEKIGMPEYDFFIYADDSEFMMRAKKANLELGLIKNARLNRRLPVLEETSKFTWKHYYIVRNVIILDFLHGSFFAKNIRPYIYYYIWLNRAKNIDEKNTVRKAFKDAFSYKSSKNKIID